MRSRPDGLYASVPAGGFRFSIVRLCSEADSYMRASPGEQEANLSQLAVFLGLLNLLENLE